MTPIAAGVITSLVLVTLYEEQQVAFLFKLTEFALGIGQAQALILILETCILKKRE